MLKDILFDPPISVQVNQMTLGTEELDLMESKIRNDMMSIMSGQSRFCQETGSSKEL